MSRVTWKAAISELSCIFSDVPDASLYLEKGETFKS